MVFFIFWAFVLGLVIGSFLNVVIYRYNTGLSISRGRSMCFSCGKTLVWYELIPIFSFLLQRGRCTKCKARISWQYSLVELMTGIIFAGIVAVNGLVAIDFFYAIVWSILIVIFVYDLKHKIIPDGLSYLFAGLSLLRLVAIGPNGYDLIAGPLLFLPFYLLWKVSKGRWMGLGDGKLALGIGWFLGLQWGIVALLLAFWVGAAFAMLLLVAKYTLRSAVFHKLALRLSLKERIMKSEIPFAPFLIIGIALVFFFNLNPLYYAFIIQ